MARKTIFQKLQEEAGGRELSVQWYRSKIKQIAPRVTASQLIRQGKATARPNYGLMNLFNYRPLGPDRLKYYDMFPLVIPFRRYRNGFVGINFHYLSIPMRVNLLERLSEFEVDHELYARDEFNSPVGGRATGEGSMGTKSDVLALTWQKIQRIRGIKPCVHRYRAKYVYTNFLKIELDEMVAAILLPVERYYSGDLWTDKQGRVLSRDVWRDSRREVYG